MAVSWQISELTAADYDEAFALWSSTEGMSLGRADSREAICKYLQRNRALSLAARLDGRIVGTVLCGHDGRRGYLHHVAVARQCRGGGMGRELVKASLERLAVAGIEKCHVFVHVDNRAGAGFWRKIGWVERTDLRLMSKASGQTK